jgi:crotonobetainyl-CoA:carnitine CoA-transferase CaiB-like acyl-CoA transferase
VARPTTAPLSGIRVLDLSIWRPGPYATSLLCALGADVLKVEPPGGDPMRGYPGLFEEINAGKRSMVLDLKELDDRARARELCAEADALVEGFRPGVMTRLGLDEPAVRAVNRGIVYCSISGYGQRDRRAALPGHDVNYQAWAGALAPDGGPAALPRIPAADLASGLASAFGICASLLGRRPGSEGTYLDVSMTDVMATWTGRTGSASEGSSSQGAVPGYGLFPTADGHEVALGVLNEQHFWSALCEELGLSDLATLDFAARSARGDELQKVVSGAIAARARDELVAALVAAGVPVSPVLDRAAMVASAPFPAFPIRLPAPVATGAVPRLDEHRGQGFRARG